MQKDKTNCFFAIARVFAIPPGGCEYLTNKGTGFSFGDFGDGDTPSQGEVLRIVPPTN